MTEHSIRNSYSHQFASRQPTTIEKRDTIIGNKQSKSSSLWKNKHDTAFKGQKKSVQAQKTLIDALKQHGMRLCDGARLNAVGKGIHLLGYVPPTVSASITALYLSQNNLRSLEGIDQFAAVRLLSIGGNLISSDMEVERLTELAQLRNLNLMGNPVCDLPNYRLRAIAILTKLQVLDNADVTKKERALAPDIAAQDHALRSMVTQNHFNIQKLQRIAQLISLHKSFYAYVMAGIATGKFDRVPNPKDVACNIPLLLRLWKYEDTMSREEQESLEIQMLTIVMRTHARLAENPKEKAKDYLRKLASGSLSQLSDDLKQHCLSWEEAYTNVITLQQKTTANLLAICEKNRSQMVNYLKELLATDPIQRNETADCRRREQNEVDSEVKPFWSKTQNQGRMWLDSRSSERLYPHNDRNTLHSNHRQLPPQQIDPETRNRQSLHSHLSGLSASSVQKNNQVYADSDFHDLEISVPPARELRSSLRGGDFANKSLGEAIHDFKLRDSAPRMRGLQQPCKIRRTNFSQQQVDISLPQRLSSEQFPSERQNCSARLQKRGHKLNLSYCNTDVVSDFNDGELTPSTPSNLDLKSTSASSRAPISPVRNEGVPSDETSVPLAKISLKSHAHAQCASGSEPILSPRRPYLNYDEQLDESDHLEPVTALHDGRFQELEQREEKYIRALMQSEQRELDLRNNLSNVQRKLHSYQQTLAQQLHERETIKDEMAQRTVSIATPKILKRYFVRWIHYCNWSHQICHIRRKRCFIVQHDRFWQWRRKVWRQQEVRHCLRRRQRKLQKSIFIEWINCTRITVIAKRNQLVRETQFLNRVFQAWIYGAAFLQNKRVASRKQQVRFANQCQCSCFREWKRTTRIKRALERMQHLRWQDLRRISAQTVFWNWKLYLFSIARLLQHRATQFKTRIQFRQKRLHFQEWHKLRIIDKVHNIRLRRRMWTRWVTWRRHVQTAENGVHKAKLGIKNAYFCAWQLTASEQATSRRSLNLAKRYVNRRRLRKLWTYWKYFSMAKRKYTQNSTKAFKHYFIRLLRASWGAWKAQAQFNLQNAKTSKYGALERHFDAFLTGIRLVRVQQARKKMIMHAKALQTACPDCNISQKLDGISCSLATVEDDI
ncbi:Leucine-rich repeat [Plasmopara halstedii]|uniref:Leucine-rich repeat n=1 Tax=Plasmopara halstedii TaxID=4781 RepID=A0A0P1A6A7_PLAHL|nr:Leucine-rich repeat [Plasmopara halstedii]CEG35934.1 Leucine-rich repeat [Plasmopara halstedii]|eukprot:XP_024572303.1 Leucine-rich repeat [Plasmopara halstedii]